MNNEANNNTSIDSAINHLRLAQTSLRAEHDRLKGELAASRRSAGELSQHEQLMLQHDQWERDESMSAVLDRVSEIEGVIADLRRARG